MALSRLTSSDAGASARNKINAAIGTVDDVVTGQADQGGRISATEAAISSLGRDKANQSNLNALSETVSGVATSVAQLATAKADAGEFRGFVDDVVAAQASDGRRLTAAEAAIGDLGRTVGQKVGTATFDAYVRDQAAYVQGLDARFGPVEKAVSDLGAEKASQFNLTSLNRVFDRYRTSNDAAVGRAVARCDAVDLRVDELARQTAATGARFTDLDGRTDNRLAEIRIKKADRSELAALQSLFDANRVSHVDQPTRPGENSLAFTVATSPDELGGRNDSLPLLAARLIAEGDSGAVARLKGAGIIAQRRARSVEYGRVYRARAVIQRRANPSDPAGDAVRVAVVWLDQTKRPLSGAAGVSVIADIVDLKTSRGRVERSALYGRAAGEGITLVAPPWARYARAFVQTYGADGVTDVEVIDIEDVTAAVLLPPAYQDNDARITALESQDTDARLAVVEAVMAAPSTVTLASLAALRTTSIPASARLVQLLGYAVPGDGGAARYTRSPSGSKATETVTSVGGTRWEIMERVIRPEMFGATGDGIVDDAPVIRRIFAFLTAMGGGALLYSAGRTYRQHNSVSIRGNDILITREAGARIYYPQTDFAFEHCLIIKGDRVTADGLLIVSDEELERNDTGFGICVETGFEVQITNCILQHIASASIWVQNATRTTVSGCTSLDSKADGIHFSNGADRFICTGNRVERAHDDAIAMVMDTTDAARVTNGLVSGNTVSEIYTGSGIVFCGVDATVVTANTITGTDNPAVSCYNYDGVNADRVRAGASIGLVITGNTITAGGRKLEGTPLTTCAVLMSDGFDVTIRGNTIIGSGGAAGLTSAAILLTRYRRMRIIGNTISGCSGHGIWLYDDAGVLRPDLDRLTVASNDFSDIAGDPVRVAPIRANPGTVTVTKNTFEACAYLAGARLIRIGRTTDQKVIVTKNDGDGSTYAIDRATCYNVVANENIPVLAASFDPKPRAEMGEFIDVTGRGTWIDRADSGYFEISVSMDDVGTGQQLLVELPFDAFGQSIPNVTVNELTEGIAFRAALSGTRVLKITTLDNRSVAKTGRFIVIAGEVRKVAVAA